jgi:hypothetical protein
MTEAASADASIVIVAASLSPAYQRPQSPLKPNR